MSKKLLILVLTFILTGMSCYATHIVGGSLTYVHNGGSNYTITLKLYRDCGAGTAALPGNVVISVLGNNGLAFSPSKDITIPLSSVTNVPSSLNPCAIPPNPLPCVQEAIYTKTVSNLPSVYGGYHLYYQIVARNLTLTNVNAVCSCIGESFYAHIPGTNETDIWNENFSLANGMTSDNGPTAWSTSSGPVSPGSAMVNNNVFEVSGANNGKNTWTSQTINISSCTSVGVTVNLEETGTLDANDSISVYYRINGGPLTLFPVNGFRADDFTSALASVAGLTGNTLQIIIKTRFDGNSPNSEIYKIDNIDVTCYTGAFISNSSPVFNLFPPLFLCVNQPFTFNHAATDINGDSLVYSFYTPYDGDNGVGPLDPVFPSNTASFTPITFLGGYSASSPLGSPLTLNPSTGLLSGTPTLQGQFVVGVLVKEYRNGVYLGQTLRDFQFNVLNCPQPPPAITVTNISINNGCVKPLIASGISSVSATWNSIFPGAAGAYNNYLSCTSGCLNPTVSVVGTPPPYVDYVVCGNSISCAGTYVCDTVRVTFNSSLAVNIQPSNPTLCFGQTSTTLTATGTGGTPPYTYLWNNVNSSQSIYVGVGTYNVKVSDASGCPPAFGSIVVNSYSVPINANAGPDKIACKQNPLATINATVTGASGGIWSGGSGVFSPNNTTLSNLNYNPSAAELAAGSATLFLTSTGNGNCPLDVDTLVIRYSNFTATATTSVVNISCYGGNNGASSVALTGGTGPFSYSWSTFPVQTSSVVSNLSIGVYSVTITDGIGCTKVSTVTITQPAPLTAILTGTNVSCKSGNNGAITATASGGNAPYTYSWLNNGSVSPSITGLTAGTYSLIVTDSRSCTISQTISITEPTLLTVSLTGTNVACFNGNTGLITSTVSGGTSAYAYNWLPGGSTSPSISSLIAGTYTLNVTDAKGCVKSQTLNLSQPAALLATTSVTNESCNYLNNGALSASPSGGTPGYTYQWQPGSLTTNSITGLSSGNYTLTVTDSKGCVTTTVATVTEPAALNVNISSQVNVACFGGNNGSVSAAGIGGTPNYTYSWTPGGSSGNVLSGVTAGIYTLQVKDAKSCATQTTVTITQPAPLTAILTGTNVSCKSGNNGAITTTASGGNAPYTYSWLNNGSVSPSITGLTAGTYSLIVTDSRGCTISQTISITEPTLLTVSLTGTNVACFNGNTGLITSTVSGGTSAYAYNWLPGGSTSPSISSLIAGTYTLNVTDAKGCVKSQTLNLSQPAALLATTSVTNESCNYLNNGALSASPSGGTPGYTYQWQPGSLTTNSITGLSSGNYTLTVTDSKGCVSTTVATVTEPAALNVNISSQVNVACFGGNNGSVSAAGIGGTPNYTYSWTPGGSSGNVLSGVTAGTYTLQVKDTKSCATQTTVTITQPAALSVNAGVTNVSCNGGNNGIISISPTGGTAPYFHTLFPGNIVSSNFSSLSPGTYTVVTSDANNCQNTTTVNLSQPTNMSSVISNTNSNCGFQNGAASVSITSGGVPPFTYQWLPTGGNGSVANNLFAGSYSVTVYDANGCLASNIININDMEGPVVSIVSTTNVSCFGGSNGSAVATFTGGNGPTYTYSWSPSGGNSLTANSLPIGNYVIKVTDDLGCIGLATTPLITQPSPVVPIVTGSPVSCFGGNNGSASVIPSGGTPGYSYQWLPGGTTTQNVTSLSAGNYTVIVNDTYSCTSTSTIAVTQPTSAVALVVSSNSVSCFGGSDGSTGAIASGGVSPYSYSWTGTGINGSTLSNMPAGNYSVTSTDFNGCTITKTVTVAEPLPISITMSSVNSNCGNASGQASVAVSGGAGSYSYVWSPNGGTAASAVNLLSGNYTVTVSDANGCNAINTTAVSNNPAPTANVTGVADVVCFGGSTGTATVNVTGGTGPFTYSWSPIGGNGIVGTNLTIGVYTVQVVSANGCTVQAVSPVISQPLPIVSAVSNTAVSCFGGSNGAAGVVPTGGMPGYSYQWMPVGAATQNITSLSAGNYTVIVTDTYSCTSTSSVAVVQPAVLAVSVSSVNNVSCFGGNNGTASVNVSGGTVPISYNWLPYGGNGSSASGLSAGTYTVNISDVNGCTTSTIISINQPSLALSASVAVNGISCFGASNGSATVTVSGGTPNYGYQWTAGVGALNTVSGLSPGNYLTTITDANNCQTSLPIIIPQVALLSSTLIPQDAACSLANGSIASQVSGGTGPYSYSWNNGLFSTGSIANIFAGTYTLTVSDANSCVSTRTAVVNNLPGPSIGIVSSSSVSCYGANNGVATVTVTSAVLPYSLLWLPYGGSSLTSSSLTAGSYTAQLIDAMGCTVTAVTAINEPLLLSISSASVTDARCHGQSSGSVTVTVLGGSPVYTYSWSPNSSGAASSSNLPAGTYSIVVNDHNNCSTSMAVVVHEPPLLTSTLSAVVNPICYNMSGMSSVSVSGGLAPYTYNWNSTPVQTGSSATNLVAGNYTVTIADINGCAVSNSVTIVQPSQVITSAALNDTICVGQQAILSANANGGAGNYYYSWQPSAAINSGTLSVSPTSNTTYTVMAFDQNGCAGIEDNITVTVYTLNSSNIQVYGQTPICPGQASIIEGTVTGNTGPVTISWNNGLGNTTGPFIVHPVGVTSYIMSVTSSCGITVSDTVKVEFNQPPVLAFTSDTVNTCAPGTIYFNDQSVSSNPSDPITSWSWNFGDGTISSSENPSHVFNNAGTYSVILTVTTDGGCTSNSISSPIVVHAYASPTAGFIVNTTDLNIPYDVLHCTNQTNGAVYYDWSFGDGSFSHDVNPTYLYPNSGHYHVQLIASNFYGCKDTAYTDVVTRADVVFPNAFTPDPNGGSGGSYNISSLDNNVFFPYTSGVIDFKLQIFDRWGELIFESTDLNIGWDGYYKGRICQMGVYVWKAYVKLNDNRIFKKTGDVTLLR